MIGMPVFPAISRSSRRQRHLVAV